MGSHERYSTQSEWYTPKYIFDALECRLDMDVAAAPEGYGCVPADILCRDPFHTEWRGFIWCNPPWAGRGNKQPWIEFIHRHGNGLLLSPDRTSVPWWQEAAKTADKILFVQGKIKFIPGPGNDANWKHPANGTTIFAWGERGVKALFAAKKNCLGIVK